MKRILLWLLLLCCVGVASATVSNVPFSVTYTCTGGFGPYPFGFSISDPTALTVALNGVILASTSYTVVPVNNNYDNGGSVTLAGGYPCSSGSLVLTRMTPITQTTLYYDNMPLPITTFGNSLDKVTEILQELAGELSSNNTTIQMQNSGVNFLAPAGGPIVLNFVNCTVTGTQGIYTITCSGGGGGGGSGTVTNFSAQATVSPFFTTSVTNPTTTPNLAFTVTNQNANCVFAGPSSGIPAVPTCRALLNADFPTSGVTAGSYTCVNLVINAQGIITSATSGSCGSGGGNVVGPATSVAGNVAVYADTTGKLIADVPFGIDSSGNATTSGNVTATQGIFTGPPYGFDSTNCNSTQPSGWGSAGSWAVWSLCNSGTWQLWAELNGQGAFQIAEGSGLPSGTGVVRVDSSTGSATELSGDVTTSGSNAATVVGWDSKALDSTMASPSNGNTPTYNSTSGKWVAQAPAGGGVASVGLSAPGDTFDVTGSPVTSSGILALGKQSESSGYFLAGPQGTSIQTPYFVSTVTKCPFTTTTSATCALNSATSFGGHTLVVWVVWTGGSGLVSSVTDSASDSYSIVYAREGNNITNSVSYFQNIAAGVTSVTATFNISLTGYVIAMEVGNVATSSVLDTSGVGGGSACPGTGGAVTIGNANDIIINFVDQNSSETFTYNPTFQSVASSSYASSTLSYNAGYYNAAFATTYTPSIACSGTGVDGSITIALKAATTAASSQWGWRPMFWSDTWLGVFPGLSNIYPSSTQTDTQIDLHVGTPINANAVTGAYAGNDTASTLATVPALSGQLGWAYHCWVYTSCHTTVSTATVIPALLFTDEQGTAETITGVTATCTVAGTNDVSSNVWPIRAESSTTIYLKTTIANSPSYDVHAVCEQASTN